MFLFIVETNQSSRVVESLSCGTEPHLGVNDLVLSVDSPISSLYLNDSKKGY